MSTRRTIALASTALLLLAGAVFWLRAEPPRRREPSASAPAETSEPAATAPPKAAPEVTAAPAPSGSSGLPASHFEEKRRLYAEAQAAQLELEEAKYAGVDFSAKRPGPPAPAPPMQGKNEEELTPAEKAAQVERMVGLVRDRLERTEKRAAELERSGDKDEASKLRAIAARLRDRQGQLEARGRLLRGEDARPPSPDASTRSP
ncbi:MAG: hypothetical protein IT374_14020 [Polyangiaceae bacterium]|nr:hypothetical protein [Polyangiaceae bacterium]